MAKGQVKPSRRLPPTQGDRPRETDCNNAKIQGESTCETESTRVPIQGDTLRETEPSIASTQGDCSCETEVSGAPAQGEPERETD
jgi:hypothetical protein